jgi:hypothetical protein
MVLENRNVRSSKPLMERGQLLTSALAVGDDELDDELAA